MNIYIYIFFFSFLIYIYILLLLYYFILFFFIFFFLKKRPLSKSSPLNYMYTAIYLQLVKEALNKDSYHAEIADTKFNIKLSNEGSINV